MSGECLTWIDFCQRKNHSGNTFERWTMNFAQIIFNKIIWYLFKIQSSYSGPQDRYRYRNLLFDWINVSNALDGIHLLTANSSLPSIPFQLFHICLFRSFALKNTTTFAAINFHFPKLVCKLIEMKLTTRTMVKFGKQSLCDTNDNAQQKIASQ